MIDSHCHIHYYDNYLDIINKSKLKSMVCLFDIDEMKKRPQAWDIISKKIFTAIGIHPNKVDKITLEELSIEVEKYKDTIIGIGESGIDLHYSDESTLPKQIESLEYHIKLCEKYKKTLILHCRDCSIDLVLSIIQDTQIPIILHSFNYRWQDAQKALKQNCFISLSGMLTFKSCQYLEEVAQQIPINQLLLETDSPYLTPCPFRGQKNYPDYVKYNYIRVSQLRNIPMENIIEQVENNFKRAFNLVTLNN